MVGLITMAVLGAAAVGLLSLFWKDICNFLERAMAKVRQLVTGMVMGAKIFIQKIWEGVQEISKTYSYDRTSRQWEETTIRRTVPPSDVPAEYLAMAERMYGEEVDMTNELEMQLSA